MATNQYPSLAVPSLLTLRRQILPVLPRRFCSCLHCHTRQLLLNLQCTFTIPTKWPFRSTLMSYLLTRRLLSIFPSAIAAWKKSRNKSQPSWSTITTLQHHHLPRVNTKWRRFASNNPTKSETEGTWDVLRKVDEMPVDYSSPSETPQLSLSPETTLHPNFSIFPIL